ncbi:hypothetical protein PINS_up010289 [Pythium insidiosum]|nr:hypothetical protein PINS_up010289 [Pythium insidiosum]
MNWQRMFAADGGGWHGNRTGAFVISRCGAEDRSTTVDGWRIAVVSCWGLGHLDVPQSPSPTLLRADDGRRAWQTDRQTDRMGASERKSGVHTFGLLLSVGEVARQTNGSSPSTVARCTRLVATLGSAMHRVIDQ